jgi:PKD repeat protein
MFKVIRKFANTDIVFANSKGPYFVNAGSPVTLSPPGAPNPNASYAWELGDGTTASTPSVVHTYGNDGVYLAKLTVKVNQPGGDTSNHYALIYAKNVPPVVNAGPDLVVKEGDIVSLTGSFTDVQWLETHQAVWDWGDSQSPDPGVITESHNPPLGQGTVTGKHAWGDNGIYTVTLRVQDKGGAVGLGQAKVTVLNVPPTVDAGPPMFAYPCCVLTLEGKFTDPGWLDTHAGFWNFGDCSGLTSAVIREEHNPPAGKGLAISSHVYHTCGIYKAECIVIDDDGGIGTAATIITVVDIRNAGFEEGFCSRKLGVVGNHWDPYIAEVPPTLLGGPTPIPAAAFSSDIFHAEEFSVHSGERSQRITLEGRVRAGVMQRVGANPEWDYQITAWYSLNERAGGTSQLLSKFTEPADMTPPDAIGGTARLGIDPTGGTDPSSHNVIWSNGYLRPEWAQLSVRATATANAITIFLEGEGHGRLGADLFFDDAALVAVQPFCPEEKPEPPKEKRELCVDFSDVHPDRQMPPKFTKDKFTFVSLNQQPQLIVALGPPISQNGLEVHPKGLEILLPFPADKVSVTVTAKGSPISVEAFDSGGNLVAQGIAPNSGTAETVTLSAKGITNLRLMGKEGLVLIKVCAQLDVETATKP